MSSGRDGWTRVSVTSKPAPAGKRCWVHMWRERRDHFIAAAVSDGAGGFHEWESSTAEVAAEQGYEPIAWMEAGTGQSELPTSPD